MSEIWSIGLVGDSACGKTCMVEFISTGHFPYDYVPTFMSNRTDIEVDGKEVELFFCDLNHLQDFDRFLPLGYLNSHVILVCFNIGCPDSLDHVVKKWFPQARHYSADLPIILVGLQSDIRDRYTLQRFRDQPITSKQGMMVASEIGATHYCECSALTGEGVREVFQYAARVNFTQPERHREPRLTAASRGIKSIKRFFTPTPKPKVSAQPGTVTEGIPFTATQAELAKSITNSSAPNRLKIFRLLIIGKTGCGKTTILSKVCGGNVLDAPNTVRGIHNIEEEIKFEGNDQMVAHDSEGFEAGRTNEVNVVKDFIERRSKMDNINLRLHLVWYCIEMNSRPIQHAEKEFFSTLSQVPVIAVVTKFDAFVQDVHQQIEEAAEEEDSEIDDDKLEKEAARVAMTQFDQHYKQPLESLPFPPKVVVALSDVHKSTPDDSRLARLIQVTMEILALEDPHGMREQRMHYNLSAFFGIAQNADTKIKLDISVSNGMFWNYDRQALPMYRNAPFIKIWGTFYTCQDGAERQLIDALERTLDHSPRIIGHPDSPDLAEVMDGNPNLLRYCRWEQMAADTTLIMEKVFIYGIQDKIKLEALIKWYDQHSTTAAYIRNEVMTLYRTR